MSDYKRARDSRVWSVILRYHPFIFFPSGFILIFFKKMGLLHANQHHMSLAAWEISESRLLESWAPGKGSLWGSWRNGGKSGSRLQEKAVALKVVGSRFFPAPLQETWAQAPIGTGGTAHFNLAQIYTWNSAAVISNLQPRTEHCLGRGVGGGGYGVVRADYVEFWRRGCCHMPSQQPPPPPSLFLYSSKHMFTAGPLIQNSTKRGQSSQQVIYCRGAAVPHTPHLLSEMRPNPHYVTQDQLFLFLLTKVWCTHNSSVLTLLAQLVGIMEAISQNLLC